jgi:hypothetical protein
VRAAVLIAALALALAPAAVQAKAKDVTVPELPAAGADAPAVETETPASEDAQPAETPDVTSGEPVSVQAFQLCLNYAKGDVLAGETAKQLGWEAFEDQGESPFVKTYSGNKTFTDVGDAALFSLVESYPDTTFGYCRVDIQAPTGEADVNALRDLPELAGGQVITNGDGTFGSWKGAAAEPQLLLLSHQTADAYVLQMTVITHRAGPAEAK